MTFPVGILFGKVCTIWNFTDLSSGKAMETALIIAAAVAGIYILYYVITCRIACRHVICGGGENSL